MIRVTEIKVCVRNMRTGMARAEEWKGPDSRGLCIYASGGCNCNSASCFIRV